ncbi:ion channel protein, partial [Schumannella luteola]
MDEHEAGGAGEAVAPEPRVRALLLLALPALAVGVGSALTLWVLDVASDALGELLWTIVPDAVGVANGSPWWTIAVLTATGLLVGLTLRFVPGHGGADSATTEFDSPPPPATAVPSIAIAVVLGLAGGVSLGPENPIIAINGALAVAAFARVSRLVPQRLAVTLAVAGTIGALFGTPVAAALVLTGAVAAI